MPFRGLFRKPPIVATSTSGDAVVRHYQSTSAEVCHARRRLSTVGSEIGYKPDGAHLNPAFIGADDQISVFGTAKHISFSSRVGMAPTNPNKVNQDRCWITDIIASADAHYSFVGVADGHGVNGHSVAEMIRTQLGLHYEKQVALHSDMKLAIKSAHHELNDEILESHFDASFSGAAAISVLLGGNKLYCANLGDCRCILGSRQGDVWQAIPLSRDHKPDLPEELRRIQDMGGRVSAYRNRKGNPIGPSRVWLQSKEVPGLAMSRSFGDKVAASVGVSSDPEITERTLQPEDKILVLASDGVWDVLSNQAVLELVTPFHKVGDARGAAELVCQSAENRWKEEDDVVDDITAVILFL